MAIRGKKLIEQTISRPLSVEEKALIYLSSPVNVDNREIMHCLKQSDPQQLKSLILRHKLTSAMFKNEHFSSEDIPFRIRQILKNPSENITRRMLILSNEIVTLNDELRNIGLRPVFLKGPPLALQLFQDVGKRYSVDIDLLVQKEALPFVHDVLMSLNYKTQKTNENKSWLAKRVFSYAKKDWTYVKSQPRIPLELHYRLFPNNTYEKKETHFVRNGTEELMFGGTPIHVLKPMQHFLFLCAHGSVHQWFQLFWLKDIAEFVHQERVESWRAVVDLAENMGLTRSLVLAVDLSQMVFGTALPGEIERSIHTRVQRYLRNECIKTIFNPIHETMPRRLHRMWYLSNLDSSWAYKFNTFLGGMGRFLLEG